jgi:hypothetical protein
VPNELEASSGWLNEPPNPTFFHVEPEGGSDSVEGLISWLVATARAHCVSSRVLVKCLLKNSERYRDVWSGTTFFDRDCTTINGYGAYARLAVELLQERTHVPLAPLTLLHAEHLLPHNSEGALCRHPKWCPVCLCEQARAHQRLHFKLLWSLEHYRVCHEHQIPLSDRCPACGSLQSFIPVYPSLVHCNACGRPLLAEIPQNEEPEEAASFTDYELWCAKSLVGLVGHREELQTHGSLATFRENITGIVSRFSPGNRKGLCESIGLQAYALNGWLNKDERPSLSVLLRFGYGVSVDVAELFLPDAVKLVSQPKGLLPAETDRNARPMLGFQQQQNMKKLLDVIIVDPTDNRALVKVAEQLGLSRSALKYWFDAECRAIVCKNRNSESLRLRMKYRKDHDLLRSIVQLLRSRDLQPTRRRVDRELRKNGLSLMRPDIFIAYQELKSAGP